MPKTLYLIDGHSHIYAGYYATMRSGMTSPEGQPTNAVYVFTRMLQKLLRRNPDHVAVVMDAGKKTFRNDLFDAYKAQRKPMPDELVSQLPLIDKVIDAHGLKMVKKPGFEADDIIATLARRAEREGFDVFILTSDKDAQQLLSDRVRILDNRKDEDAFIDVASLKAEKGIAPEQVVEAMALSGDASDNVPGVPGIGPATAFKLIQQYGTLENVLSHADEAGNKKQQESLRNFADQARLSKSLVTLDDRVPLDVGLEDLKPSAPDRAKLLGLYRSLGFKTFLEELLQDAPKSERTYRLIDTPGLFEDFRRRLAKQKRFSIDLETTSRFPRDADVVGISFSWDDNEGDYLALMAPLGEPTLDSKAVVDALKPTLEDESVRKVGQNLKYDATVLLNVGVDMKGIDFDTMLASYVLNPGKREHGLKDLAVECLGHKMTPIEDLIGKGKKQIRMNEVPSQRVCEYSCDDANVAWRIAEIQRPLLAEANLDKLYSELEIPLIDVLRDMQWTGIAVDAPFLRKLGGEMGERLATLEKKIYASAGEEFNIDSPQQLGKVLFEKLELPGQGKTRTGQSSTDQDVLEKLATMHELPKLVVEYRQIAKLKGTYVDALQELVSRRTGRIHASFNQTMTATGRLSSSEPNLQNIPVRTEEGERIREAFVAGGKGLALLSADYSQIELRILAHYSGDPELVGAFRRNEDIHALVAAQINEVEQKDVTPAMRAQAKTVNFGIMYGQTPYGLSAQLGIGVDEAAAFIDRYYKKYQGVERFFEDVLKECQSKGYVTTLMGRRRYLQGIQNTDGSNRNRNPSERMAINTVCQGSAADMIKKAMINLRGKLKSMGMKTKLLLQIHDELLFETPEDELDAAKRLVADEMRSALPLKVPVEVNLGSGKNWREV